MQNSLKPRSRSKSSESIKAVKRETNHKIVRGIQSNKLYVGSLPSGINEYKLKEKFEDFGPITDIHLKSSNARFVFMTF